MRPTLIIALCAAALACPPQAAAAETTSTLRTEVRGLLNRTAAQWARQMTPAGDFENPFPADLARGHGSFVPPMLAYAVHRAGQRRRDPALVAAAERAWPRSVDPVRASAFDMVGASYAYRKLALSDARRAQLAGYMSRYGIPLNGRRCLILATCYGNLRLVDALAVIGITGNGVRAADPAARLANPGVARAYAVAVVNRWIGRVVDHRTRVRIGRRRMRGSLLSDPRLNTTAYHALSAFMLSEAVAQLGPNASRSARRARRETLDTLAALVAPDGDMSYLGRGQGQAWVPALVAGAMARGARRAAGRDPVRAARYLAVARRAVRRLEALHASEQGFRLVPGARTTVDGIDVYAHTVAYNGLALFGLTVALDALRGIPELPLGRLPAEQRLKVKDVRASGLGVVSNRRVWVAVLRTPMTVKDVRYDFGALALKRRTAQGWVDLLAPRPLAPLDPNSAGPALVHHGVALPPRGRDVEVLRRTVRVTGGGYRIGPHWVRRARFRWTLTDTGVQMTVTGARRGDLFRMLAYTPAGTGGWAGRSLLAAGAHWRFNRPIVAGRLPGYHSGPVEQLDALEARFTAPKSGRIVVTIGI
ncbi:MAG TPA: hypothetical protein VKA57_08475 [Solirubrobacteraceae bacterium]|nr:hypothetical protein [Solirubrobacteraceae bacterium]